ncbi:hypothetical protein CLV60_12245 [Dyadobacter jiangsuensis]|uniref:Uncharacterized protein n=1 Tax=Dyadobacter jiangsuensis TaxID=1591085 RepID=A0A2P8FI70_9BACT|nr:hypothetical protein CLV60_12245 [Dyadobacter jiangsuensis]
MQDPVALQTKYPSNGKYSAAYHLIPLQVDHKSRFSQLSVKWSGSVVKLCQDKLVKLN